MWRRLGNALVVAAIALISACGVGKSGTGSGTVGPYDVEQLELLDAGYRADSSVGPHDAAFWRGSLEEPLTPVALGTTSGLAENQMIIHLAPMAGSSSCDMGR